MFGMTSLRKDSIRLLQSLVASLLMALVTNIFLKSAHLVPGGMNGLSLLLQRLFRDFMHLDISFSLINLTLNALPAIFAFWLVGRRFVIFSTVMVISTSLLVDLLPDYAFTHDMLLVTVFGGLAYGLSISIALNANSSSGGTDFIAMIFSNKYNISTWNYVLAFNGLVIFISGSIYGFDKAMYSIIFQVFSTQVVTHVHNRYQRRTVLLITRYPNDLSKAIMKMTNHGITVFEGIGCYTGQKKYLMYMVVGKKDLRVIKQIVKALDDEAFMNVFMSQNVTGKFYLEPID